MTDDVKRAHQVPAGTRIRREDLIKQMFAVRVPVPGHTNQARHIRDVRQMGAELARVIYMSTPECADQSAAIRKVREAVQAAEEAIHLEGLV